MISGLTLLHAEKAAEMRDRWSYVLLSEELRRVVKEPKRDAQELFRRMVFQRPDLYPDGITTLVDCDSCVSISWRR